MNLSVHNHFDVELRDAKTGNIKQRCTAYNTVLDNLYNKWCNIATAGSNYVSYLYVTSNTTPMTTSDTTAPSPRWESSLHLSNGNYAGNTYTQTKSGTTTFAESTANATLTAVMVGYIYNNIFTYAQFTDAEGHPITITKTSSDTLTITYTMYVTFIYDWQHEPVQLLPSAGYWNPMSPQDIGNLSKFCPAYLNRLGISNWEPKVFWLSTISKYSCIASSDNSGPNYISSGNNIGMSNNRFTTSRILSTSANAKITYQIRGLVLSCFTYDQSSTYHVWYRPTEFIPLPNHTIYPPKQITLTTAGDGTTLEFNLGVPFLMTNNVEVLIDDVVQTASSYTFNCKDYTFYQAWESCDTEFVTSLDTPSTYSSVCLHNFPYISSNSYCTLYKNCYYDFKSPITVTRLKGYASYTSKRDEVYYSNDNENWTRITDWTASSSDLILTSPIQARYWKILNMGYSSVSDTLAGSGEVSTAFGNPKPQLRFNTAPPAGSTITVKAYIEYPIKNSNWIIEPMTIDFNVQRGT